MVLLLVILSFVLLSAYAILINKYRWWFSNIPTFEPTGSLNPATRFSVVISARNEEQNIRACLSSILQQQYPTSLFEVLMVNDHSTDSTAAIVQSMLPVHCNLRLLNLADFIPGTSHNSYKKKAIELAIAQAGGDWIVATDADCFATAQWLATYDAFIQLHQPAFVAAPVNFINKGSFLSIFQCLDFISLQGITAASVHHNFHSMCNGANLAYRKQVFNQVGGFAGIDTIASGDDMLLMHKIYSKYPGRVKFLLSQDAIIETDAMPNWKSFLNQRIRWASKADVYDDKRIFWVLALVYALNAGFLVIGIAAFFAPVLFGWLLCLLAGKTIIELRFMHPVAGFFKEKQMLNWFPVMQPFHILYTIVAGWLGKFGTYQWKGRKVK